MGGDGGGPRPTRDRLLDAAVQALESLTTADLVTAIGTREIARRAEVSPAAFFHHFGSVAEFAEALLEHLYSIPASPLGSAAERLDELRSSQLPVDTEYEFHEGEFLRQVQSGESALRTALAVLGGPQAATAYRRYVIAVEDRISVVYGEVIKSWGREARPPFDVVTLSALHTALFYGTVLRHRIDPERLDAGHFKRAATALNLVLLRLIGDRHTVDDRLTEMNYYPLRDARTGVPVRGRRAVSRARVLASAASLFASHGYENTSIAAIARGADVSESTVYEKFATKASLASALWSKQAGDLLASRADDPLSPGEGLRRLLVDLARFTGTHLDHAPFYLNDLVCHAPVPTGGDEVRRRVGLAVAQAQDADRIRRDLAADDLAELMLTVLISRVIGGPAERPESAVAWVLTAVCPLTTEPTV
ncbi:MAG TPA: TetR/AcrR family transcriptional regulator [Jatrophihabitans sp.]|uniref:TetR/AcrR family transcriptional regulator n=1 Tax=Jatrophihabitans sp. TaxID=1932789 RepID=UPI002DF85693|nr:TetR/AcrR family transcriptional regulator [Jatrophihabitans sp.]